MIAKTSITILLLLGLVTFFLASCSHNDSDSAEKSFVAPSLHLGLLTPMTGAIAFLDPEPIEAASLAVSDIIRAGGMVRLSVKDSGTEADVALKSAREFIDDDVNAIIGAFSSLVSLGIIDEVIASGTVMMSPASSSGAFTNYEDGNEHNLFFRTVTSNELWAPVAAGELKSNGSENVAFIFRDDDFGQRIAAATKMELERRGMNVALLKGFDTSNPDPDAIAAEVAAANVDTVILSAFAEGVEIVASILAQAKPENFYLSGPPTKLGELVNPENPGIISGLVNIDTAADHPDAIVQLIGGLSHHEEPYTGTVYDAVVIIALAAFAAQSSDPLVFSKEINGVTRDGVKCTSYAQCETLLRADENIDYDGASGPLEFSDAGEPTSGAYKIFTYDSAGQATDGRVVISSEDS